METNKFWYIDPWNGSDIHDFKSFDDAIASAKKQYGFADIYFGKQFITTIQCENEVI